ISRSIRLDASSLIIKSSGRTEIFGLRILVGLPYQALVVIYLGENVLGFSGVWPRQAIKSDLRSIEIAAIPSSGALLKLCIHRIALVNSVLVLRVGILLIRLQFCDVQDLLLGLG